MRHEAVCDRGCKVAGDCAVKREMLVCLYCRARARMVTRRAATGVARLREIGGQAWMVGVFVTQSVERFARSPPGCLAHLRRALAAAERPGRAPAPR